MEEKIKQSHLTIYKYFFTVTTLSKLLALLFFILFPIVGFYLGMQYQEIINKNKSIVTTNDNAISSNFITSNKQLPFLMENTKIISNGDMETFIDNQSKFSIQYKKPTTESYAGVPLNEIAKEFYDDQLPSPYSVTYQIINMPTSDGFSLIVIQKSPNLTLEKFIKQVQQKATEAAKNNYQYNYTYVNNQITINEIAGISSLLTTSRPKMLDTKERIVYLQLKNNYVLIIEETNDSGIFDTTFNNIINSIHLID